MSVFKYSPVDFLFICVGLLLQLLDVALDAVALVSFYQEGAYWSLGVLLLLLMGSSALVQAFSWLWYSDPDSDPRHTRVEKWPSRGTLRLLHLLQLGVYLR